MTRMNLFVTYPLDTFMAVISLQDDGVASHKNSMEQEHEFALKHRCSILSVWHKHAQMESEMHTFKPFPSYKERIMKIVISHQDRKRPYWLIVNYNKMTYRFTYQDGISPNISFKRYSPLTRISDYQRCRFEVGLN